MERLVHCLVTALQARTEVGVVGPAGCAAYVPSGTRVGELPLRPLAAFLARSVTSGLRLAGRLRPATILCGSGLLAPSGRLLGWLTGTPVVCLLHGLDVVVDHPLYRAVFLPAIRGCDRLIANSRHTADLALGMGIPADRLVVINPGADAAPPPDSVALAGFRARFDLHGPVLLSVGRLTARKGLLGFVQQCLPRLLLRCPDAMLLVVGAEARQALGPARTPVLPALQRALQELALTDRVRFAGDLSDADLALAYGCASALAFPVLDLPGDVEGFGMVALEAAAHGLPTVAFAVGGVPDAIAPGRSGILVAPGDYPGMADALGRLLEGSEPAITGSACRSFAQDFSWASRAARLLEVVATLEPARGLR